ncbi:MAG: SRPBCC family protein [Acidobacteriota bacterium]
MASNDYQFITHWRVRGTINEVADILRKAEDLPRWWPSVYLDVKILEPGDAEGVGKVVDLYTKGWLPYTLRWQFRVTESHYPHGFALEAWGDFIGLGVWTFKQDGEFAVVTYDWRIRAEKPLLRSLSFLLKPFFAANHKWAMERGEQSLKLELARLHAKTPEEAARIPAPPLATFTPARRN